MRLTVGGERFFTTARTSPQRQRSSAEAFIPQSSRSGIDGIALVWRQAGTPVRYRHRALRISRSRRAPVLGRIGGRAKTSEFLITPIESLMPIVNRVADLQPDIQAWRRDIHQHPELLYDTHRT